MERELSKRQTAHRHQGADYGTGVVITATGHMRQSGAARVVIEDRPDPMPGVDRRVRGARRFDVIAAMFGDGRLTKRQHDAAQQFRDDLCLAAGRSPGGYTGMPSATGRRDSYPPAQLDAITRVHQVRNLLGINDGTVFWWCVVRNETPKAWEVALRVQHGAGINLLGHSLDGLDMHYFGRPKSGA